MVQQEKYNIDTILEMWNDSHDWTLQWTATGSSEGTDKEEQAVGSALWIGEWSEGSQV